MLIGLKKNMATVLLLTMLCIIGLITSAQTPRKFERHDIVDVGNGQKAEIIQCRGEGPLEECDVIYYTVNRAQGTRMWQNANRLREDERAALLVKHLQKGKVNSLVKTQSLLANDNGERANNLKDNLAKTTLSANRVSSLTDTAAIGRDSVKDANLHKVIRHIDSIAKVKVDTVKMALQREIEIQDSIANGVAAIKETNMPKPVEHVDPGTTDKAVIPDLVVEKDTATISDTSPKIDVEEQLRQPRDSSVSDTLADKKTVIEEHHSMVSFDNSNPVTAEVNSNGTWQKANIVGKESEYLYKVHYPGKSESEDEWVAVSQIRNMDSVKKTVATVLEPKRVTVNCSFAAPAPPVSDAEQFSVKLAKRKIYEFYLLEAKSRKSKVGVSFQVVEPGDPFVNMVTVSPTQTLLYKYAAAPPGAMVYTLKTSYTVCEQLAGNTDSKTVSGNYSIFRNKDGKWTCISDR